jgi:hypothetical protein
VWDSRSNRVAIRDLCTDHRAPATEEEEMAESFAERLVSVRVGLVLGLLAVLYGWILGAAFGAAEHQIREIFVADAEASRAVYLERAKGDEAVAGAAMKRMDEAAWRYFLRAHLHAGGIGSIAIGASLLLSMLSRGPRGLASTLLGLGAVGYPLFWMLAGLRAPGIGSTTVAKESLNWLAIPSAACLIVGALITLYLVVRQLFGTRARVATIVSRS